MREWMAWVERGTRGERTEATRAWTSELTVTPWALQSAMIAVRSSDET